MRRPPFIGGIAISVDGLVLVQLAEELLPRHHELLLLGVRLFKGLHLRLNLGVCWLLRHGVARFSRRFPSCRTLNRWPRLPLRTASRGEGAGPFSFSFSVKRRRPRLVRGSTLHLWCLRSVAIDNCSK